MNLIGFFLVLKIGLITGIISFVSWRKRTSGFSSKNKALICIGVYIIFYFCAKEIMLGDMARQSTVNITPVSQLEDVDFSNIERIIDILREAEENNVIKDVGKSGDGFSTKCCAFEYYDWSIPCSVHIRICVYEDLEKAKNVFSFRDATLTRRKHVRVSKNIEALLCKSEVVRSSDWFYAITNRRTVATSIRIKNMTILLYEFGRNNDTIGQTSSQIIEKLCIMLSEGLNSS